MKKSRKRVLSILLAVMMVLTMMPMTAMAGEGGITINGGTVTYNSIAEAVDAATDGQTINIPAGTYDVGNNFYIDKQVDLKGAGAAETIITGSIFLTQSKGNMTVSNLTMQGSGVHVALNFQGSSNGQATLEDAILTVENCIFKDYEYTIGLNSYTKNCSLQINGCEFVNCGCAAAVQTENDNKVEFNEDTDVNGAFAIQAFGRSQNDFYYNQNADIETDTADLDAAETPIIFITQKETGMADQLKNAASGIVMFTGGEYNIGSVQLSNPVSIMGSGTDTTVLNGSIAYTTSAEKEEISISGLTLRSTANDKTGINFSAIKNSKISIENCAFEGYQFGVGINSNAAENELNVASTSFNDVWCAMGVKAGDSKNEIGKLENVSTDSDCFAVQIFGRTVESGYDYGGFFQTIDKYNQYKSEPDNVKPDWEPDGGTWPSSWEAKSGDKYGSLKELVESTTEITTITLLKDIELSEPITLKRGQNITINGEKYTIKYAGVDPCKVVFTAPAGSEVEGIPAGVTLKVNDVIFEGDGTKSGYAAIIGGNSEKTNVSFEGCEFNDLYCAVYVNQQNSAENGPALSIKKCTYNNTTYGYSVDTVTPGVVIDAVKIDFNGNRGVNKEKEEFGNITLKNTDGKETVYSDFNSALENAVFGAVITLNKDIAGPVTIDKSITIKGNGHSIKASGADTAVTIDADDVRLFNVNAESEHGIALIVNEGKKNPTIEGGAYKTCTKKGGYVEDYGKQGEGAIRIMGNNGNITVRDASLTGGLHIINRGEGSLDVTNNDIRFDYKGDTALVGILITYQNSVPSEAEAAKTAASLMDSNSISVPNIASDYVQIADTSDTEWDFPAKVPANDSVAKIGTNLYKTLQDAVDAVKDNEVITLSNDCSESVIVDRKVSFKIDKDGKDFTGTISAGSGYRLTVGADGTYTVTKYVPSGGGGGTVETKYDISVDSAANGTVKASASTSAKDKTVTLTVTPDEGYVLDTLTVTDKDGKNVELTKKSDTEYTFKMPSSKVTVKAVFKEESAESALPFTDVSDADWFYPAVKYVYDNDMMDGVGSSLFAPASQLTRGMIAQVLYNLEKATGDFNGSFTDVAADEWYADAVNWAAECGIVNGFGDGTFGPEQNITREQMAQILMNYAKYKGYDVTAKGDVSAFTDAAEISGWAQDAVSWAVAEKLLSGKGNGILDPAGTATRAEVAQIFMNFCENIAK